MCAYKRDVQSSVDVCTRERVRARFRSYAQCVGTGVHVCVRAYMTRRAQLLPHQKLNSKSYNEAREEVDIIKRQTIYDKGCLQVTHARVVPLKSQ